MKTIITTLDQIGHDGSHAVPCRDIKRGEFVRLNNGHGKVYVRAGYDAATKSYQLDDTTDISRCLWAKGNRKLFIGFTY